MEYTTFNYITPPRAENKIPPSLLKFYEKRGWWAQPKMNGTNSLIFVAPDKTLKAMGRHNNDHATWSFSPASAVIFKALPGKGWYVINAELMHSKTPHIKDTNYIFDILVNDGEYLIGTTYAERYSILQSLFLKENAEKQKYFWELNKNTWLALRFKSNFLALFNEMCQPEVEGVVLKNPTGILNARSNSDWMVKARKGHKNYGF